MSFSQVWEQNPFPETNIDVGDLAEATLIGSIVSTHEEEECTRKTRANVNVASLGSRPLKRNGLEAGLLRESADENGDMRSTPSKKSLTKQRHSTPRLVINKVF